MNWLVKWFLVKKIDDASKQVAESKVPSVLKSSEFYLSILSAVGISIMKALGMPEDAQQNIIKLVGTYVASRMSLKLLVTNVKKKGLFTSEMAIVVLGSILQVVGSKFGLGPDIINSFNNLLLTILGVKAGKRILNDKAAELSIIQ
jgi:hypothetical protein